MRKETVFFAAAVVAACALDAVIVYRVAKFFEPVPTVSAMCQPAAQFVPSGATRKVQA